MNHKNRLVKLEHKANPVVPPLLMVPTADNRWTSEQLQEMKEAKAQGRMILRVQFVAPKKHVSD